MITYKMDCDGVDWDAMRRILIEDDFDNGRSPEQYRVSFENTDVVCIAYDDDNIIGTVRALSDGVCNAYIIDVWTYTPYRRKGIASKMMELVLEKLPGQHVYLFTDDRVDFYETLGFVKQPHGMSKVVGQWLQSGG